MSVLQGKCKLSNEYNLIERIKKQIAENVICFLIPKRRTVYMEKETIIMEEKDIRICPVCNKEVERNDMNFTRDCHGITFRLVCNDCWEKLMEKGYDGQYYSEADECIDEDY